MRLNKKQLELRISQYSEAILRNTGDEVFDKELFIVIHGHPFTDSRPRFSSVSDLFYNPHKALMKKLFKPIYNSDEVLQSITLDKLMEVNIVSYYKPSKIVQKHMTKEEIDSESFYSIIKKDNDNVEKIHFDLLTDNEFKILLDDNLIVKNTTTKYMSFNERVEISIKFCSDNNNIHKVYDIQIQDNMEYKAMYFHYKTWKKLGLIDRPDELNKMLLVKWHEYKLYKSKKFIDKFKKEIEKLSSDEVSSILISIKPEIAMFTLPNKVDKINLYIKYFTEYDITNIIIDEGDEEKWVWNTIKQ